LAGIVVRARSRRRGNATAAFATVWLPAGDAESPEEDAMSAEGAFEQKLHRFYDECTDEERDVVAYMCVTTLAVNNALGDEVEGFESRSDLGQKLQFQLNEANNIYTRASKAQSDVSKKYSQMLDGIAQNLK
jgi:hypothetical protein